MTRAPRNILMTPASPDAIGGAIRRFARLQELSDQDAQMLIREACRKHPIPYAEDDRAGRWLSLRQINAKSWLNSLAAFELELNVRESAKLAGLSVPTAHKVKRSIRESLAAQDPACRPLLSAKLRKTIPVPILFGVAEEEGGLIRVEPILVKERIAAVRARPPEIVHVNGFTYTDGHGGFDALAFGGQLPQVFRKRAPRRAKAPFLRFLMNRMTQHYGVSPHEFPLYLKEWEIRFNRRRRPFFDFLLDAVCRPLPAA